MARSGRCSSVWKDQDASDAPSPMSRCHHERVPAASTRQEIAALLDEARSRQHLSIRATARLVGIPPATMQGWLSGRHGPTPALRPQFTELVRALGLEGQVQPAWLDVDHTLGALRDAAAPYVGLRPYRVTEEPLFFGRDAEARRVAGAVAAVAASGHGLLALVGPSGSGKSSLLAAGLVGRHCAPGGVLDGRTGVLWQARDLTQPAETDADVIVVDQFEDVLDLGDARDDALRHLSALAARATVVLAVRADAFGRLAELPALHEVLERPLLVSPMTADEVREVIAGPAGHLGVSVEPALVEVILSDLDAGTDPQTTQRLLPLVSHALLLTWGSGSGQAMTVEDYQRAGGLGSAVENLADGIVLGLAPDQRELTRRLFLRLIGLVDDQPTRRPIPLDALPPAELAMARPFVDARVLASTDTTLQISHDAVLRHWPRLAAWVDESRQQLRVREHLTRAAALWVDNDRDPAGLIPVDRLPVFAVLDTDQEAFLTPVERAFLAESRAHFTSLLERERRTSARFRRRGRLALALAAVSLTLAVVAGLAFVDARAIKLDAQSRQVANLASTLRDRDANLHAQLSLVSHALADTRESIGSLMASSSLDVPTRWAARASAFVATGGDAVARVDGAGRVALWRDGRLTQAPDVTFDADPGGGQLFAAALARVGDRLLLVAGGAGGYRALWDVTGEPTELTRLGTDGTLFAATFEPSRRGVLIAHSDGTSSVLERWTLDAGPGSALHRTAATEFAGQVSALALTPDGHRVFAAGVTDRLDSWTLADDGLTPAASVPLEATPGTRGLSLAVSPDGRHLAAGLTSGEVARWSLDADTDGPLGLTPVSAFWVNGVAYSADGLQLLTGDSEQKLRVWASGTMAPLRSIHAPAIVQSVAYVRGEPVATTVDGTLSAWRSVSPLLRAGGDRIYYLASDADGRRWLAGTVQAQAAVDLWRFDGETTVRMRAELPPGLATAVSTAMSPAGDTLIVGTRDGQVVVWDLSGDRPGEPQVSRLAPSGNFVAVDAGADADGTLIAAGMYSGHTTLLGHVAGDGTATPLGNLPGSAPQLATFSPDGRHVQVGLAAGSIQLWDIADPAHPALAASLPVASNPGASAFSPAGRLLAAGTDGGEIYLWDWSDPAAPVLLRQLKGPRAGMNAVAFSPDGRLLVAAGTGAILWGWDLADNGADAVFSVPSYMEAVHDVAFLDGGTRLAATGASGEVRVWDLSVDRAHAAVCALRGQPLTPDEWDRYLPGVTPFDPCR